MKTILRLSIILLVMILIGVGIVALFENPTVQNRLGLEAASGRGGRAAEAGTDLFEWQGAEPGGRGNGQGRGFGAAQGEGHGFGWRGGPGEEGRLGQGTERGEGDGSDFEAEPGDGRGFGRRAGGGERIDEFPSSEGWLGLVGILLRLAIVMAVVVALVKFGRWIGRKLKPNGRIKAENASPS